MKLVTAFLAIAAATCSSIAANEPVRHPTDYRTAYEQAMDSDKPLLVLVTADWCRPCIIMKNTTIPRLLEENRFQDYHFAVVDFDKQQSLARRLIGQRGLPQMVLYEKVNGRWTTRYLAGYQTTAAVDSFLGAGPLARMAAAEPSSRGSSGGR